VYGVAVLGVRGRKERGKLFWVGDCESDEIRTDSL
jgi:hypothetical protein